MLLGLNVEQRPVGVLLTPKMLLHYKVNMCNWMCFSILNNLCASIHSLICEKEEQLCIVKMSDRAWCQDFSWYLLSN